MMYIKSHAKQKKANFLNVKFLNVQCVCASFMIGDEKKKTE